MMPGGYYYGTGTRKRATARVFLKEGNGRFTVNKKPVKEYFNNIDQLLKKVYAPFRACKLDPNKFDVYVTVKGGGISGQAGAVCHGLARALLEYQPDLKPLLKSEKLLTRDPREKERRKYGKVKARKSPQWTKR